MRYCRRCRYRIRHLPIVDADNRLVVSWSWGREIGIITQTSLLRVFDPIEMCSTIDSLQQTLSQLTTEAMLYQTTVLGLDGLSEPSASEPAVQALLTQAVNCLAIAAKIPYLSDS